ncbi:MAG: pilin [Minisyncoccia bacterium]
MKKVIIAALALVPALASAQQLGTLTNLVTQIGNIVDLAIPIVFSLALLAFFWGLVKYIFAQGNEESKADGKKIMIWGLVALFVAATVWGLVEFIRTSLGITNVGSVTPPSVN